MREYVEKSEQKVLLYKGLSEAMLDLVRCGIKLSNDMIKAKDQKMFRDQINTERPKILYGNKLDI